MINRRDFLKFAGGSAIFPILDTGYTINIDKNEPVKHSLSYPPFHLKIPVNTIIHIVSDPEMFKENKAYKYYFDIGKMTGKECGFYDISTGEIYILGYRENNKIYSDAEVLGHEIQHYLDHAHEEIGNPHNK